MKHLLYATLLFCSATALRADVFSFSYSGVGVTASGTLTANALGGGAYTVTDIITGLRNGTAITDTPLIGTLGAFFYAGKPALNSGAIMFGLKGLFGTDTVTFAGVTGSETILGLPLGSSGTTALQSVSISRLPEPSTLLLLFTMVLGVLVLARKLPFKKMPTRES